MFEEGYANSKCYNLCNCTPERRFKNMERLQQVFDEVDYKEAVAREKVKHII